MSFLSGWKSYLIALAVVIVSGLHAQGYIGDAIYQTLIGLLAGGGIAALRAAISKQ